MSFYGLTFRLARIDYWIGLAAGRAQCCESSRPRVGPFLAARGCHAGFARLTYAELGAAYPVAGGAARFPYYSHGPIAGFIAGWASWLQAVFVAPIEVLAAITYVNSVRWVNVHFNMINKVGPNAGLLNGHGLIIAVFLMVLFTAINLAGAKFLSESNAIVVPLEDSRTRSRDRRGCCDCSSRRPTSTPAAAFCLRLPWRLRRADRRRRILLAGIRAGRPYRW